MIRSAKGPLDPAARELCSLYVSLNSPVISLATLPVGPAAAAVAVHGPPAAGATLAIRSARTGSLTFYTVAGRKRPGGDAGSDAAAETALAFAESLGFLFEESAPSGVPGIRSPGVDARRWREWIGEADEALDELAAPPGGGFPADTDPPLSLSKFRCPLPASGISREDASALRSAGEGEAGPDVRLELRSRF